MFHMPVFFVCSGYLFHPESCFKEHLLKYVQNLLLPWILYNLLCAIALCSVNTFKECLGMDTHWEGMFSAYGLPTLLGYSCNQFCFPAWFLLALFWCKLLGFLLLRNKVRVKVFLLVLCSLLLWIRYHFSLPFFYCIDTGLLGFLWFCVGMYFRHHSSIYLSIRQQLLLIAIGFILCFAICRYQGGGCSYITCDVKGPMGLLGSGFGVIAFLLSCHILGAIRVRCIEMISKATLFIMCTHALFIIAFEPYIPYPGSFTTTFLFDVIIVLFLTAIKHKFHWPY